MLADNTGRPYKDIVKATERDNFLTPEEAKELGIIDRVLVSRNEMAQEKSE
jgi:Protease subunit of ATP-dependent Clp proteases